MYTLSTPSNYIDKVFFFVHDKSWHTRLPLDDYDYLNSKRIRDASVKVDFNSGIGVFYIDRFDYEYLETDFYVERYANVNLPDFFSVVDGFHYVSEKFKCFIESIDPGIHHFWKISLDEKGESLDGYYRMQVGRYVNFKGSDSTHYPSKLRSVFLSEVESGRVDIDFIESLSFFSIKGDFKTIFLSNSCKDKMIENDFCGIWDTDSKQNDSIGECFKKII